MSTSTEGDGHLLTREEARKVYEAIAAKSGEIAFRNLTEGCECRAQLMVEELQSMGMQPGRAWALAVDRPLAFPNPANPKQAFKWNNHVAPTVPAVGVEHGVLVIDPSTQTGPTTLREWASSMRANFIEVYEKGMSEADIMALQSARALQGSGLDAVVFKLRLDQSPIPELGGAGFRIGPEPAEGASAFAHAEMQRLLGK